MGRLLSILRKLRQIAGSDLTTLDKLCYVWNAARKGSGIVAYQLRGGVNHGPATVTLRPGTTDPKVFDEIFVEQTYAPCIAALPQDLGPVALVDLGANIGLSALYIARKLNVAGIIAVEPDPDNFRQLSENLRTTCLANRCTAFRAFAGAEHAFAELHDSGNGAWGMRMGAFSDTGIPVLPLAEIAGSMKTALPILLKCDIEGSERELFLHIHDWEHLIRYIVLELHTEFLPVEDLRACLKSSRFEWLVHGTPAAGASIALLLLERGERS